MAKGTEVQKLLEVRVNAAGAWRKRVRTLTGEVLKSSLTCPTLRIDRTKPILPLCKKHVEKIAYWPYNINEKLSCE